MSAQPEVKTPARRFNPPSRFRSVVLVALALALAASLAGAHDFWLVPVGDELHGVSGTHFPTSLNAVDPSRLLEAVAVSRAGRRPLEVIGKRVVNGRDSVVVLRADQTLGGTLWAAVALGPRRIALAGSEFNEYLEHDGLPQIHALRRQRGQLADSAVERYQKFAKALLVRPSSSGGSVALDAVGHRIELVPLTDPGATKAGDTLRFEIRFEGRPIPGLTVHAGYAGQRDSAHAQTHVSDAAGRVAVPLSTGGLWYLRTIHMREVHEPPIQWESFWASVTFRVR